MVSPDLTRKLVMAVGLVVTLTTLGGLLGVLAPALAGRAPPHATLTGTVGNAASILLNNVRVLAVPFLLCLLGFPHGRLGRRAGDLLILALAAASAVPVGIELGRWHARLIPYLPQLPVEWAALSAAVTAWLTAREGHASGCQLAVLAATTVALLIVAASLETWCTPHRHQPPQASLTQEDTVRDPSPLVGDGGCLRHGFCAEDGPVASRSHAPFPSPRSVPLGRLAGADRAHNNHRPPQGGITT